MTDSQLSADHTRPHSSSSHLNYLESDMIWKRTAIDKDSSKLVDPALALEGIAREQGGHGGQRRVAAERLHGEVDCLPPRASPRESSRDTNIFTVPS